MKRAVFIDRDGVIINDNGHTFKVDDLLFLPGAMRALGRLSATDYKIIIITNQSGIGRGYYTEDDYRDFTREMLKRFKAEGIRVDAVFHCPHHPVKAKGAYRVECDCRKPNTGMIKKAVAEKDVTINGSWLIGDKTSDIKAGKDAGCRTVLVHTGYGGSDALYADKPDYHADDLLDAVDIIIKDTKG